MKKLVLIRHAKSSWDLPYKDIDRPISNRGILNANLIASNIESFLPKSYILYSSSAKRTRETAMIFSENLKIPFDSILFTDELYTFDENKLENFIKKCENRYDNIILFGHNEAITNFVNKFGDLYIENVPTSGFVSLEFETNDWKTLSKGKTLKILFPRDFKNEQSNSKLIHR